MDFYTLKNGVRICLVPMPGVQSTAIGVYVATGSRFETPAVNGISHFTEHMAFKGTAKYPTTQDTSSLEGLGAVQNAWTDHEATAYYCKIPGESWQAGLDLVKDLALYPTFPEADLDTERGVIVEEINRSEDNPEERVGEVLLDMMYSPHPLGQRIIGTAEVVRRLTRQDFLQFHRERYQPQSMVVVLAGQLDVVSAKAIINQDFADLSANSVSSSQTYQDKQSTPQVKIYPKDTAEQAHVELAVRGISAIDPRRHTQNVLNAVLGAGMSSRLFRQIREQRGLCYTISSESARFSDTGLWSVHAGLNTSKLDEAITAILGEMKKLTVDLVPEAELLETKRKLRGSLIFSAENPMHQMEYFAHQILMRNETISYDTLIDSIMKVSAEDVRTLARELFKTEKLNLAVVAPVKTVDESRLKKLLVI